MRLRGIKQFAQDYKACVLKPSLKPAPQSSLGCLAQENNKEEPSLGPDLVLNGGFPGPTYWFLITKCSFILGSKGGMLNTPLPQWSRWSQEGSLPFLIEPTYTPPLFNFLLRSAPLHLLGTHCVSWGGMREQYTLPMEYTRGPYLCPGESYFVALPTKGQSSKCSFCPDIPKTLYP